MLDWLANLLLTIEPDKVLLICRTQARVVAIDAALRQRIKNVKIAVFHEGLSLVQRDRNAAWFAEKNGARILICSEIGSEGRNFQFAHHLVLFDLPLDPELLEQRIGRLDRIGQTSQIEVHVPYVAGSSHEVLVRWYQEGLNAFGKNLQGGAELLERFGARLYELAQRFPKGSKSSRIELDRLIEDTRVAHQQITERLQTGRDRLLELNSFRPEAAAAIVSEIRKWDEDRSLDDFMLAIFEQYSIQVQDIADRTYRLGSAGVLAESFPGLPADGFTVTCDRARAIAREDIQFLTWDHPLVTGALDLLLGSEKGNCSLAEWRDSKDEGLYLEAIYLLECVAPTDLQIDRFLPPTPIRIVVDHQGKQTRERMVLAPGDAHALLEHPELRDLFPFLMERTKAIAEGQAAAIVDTAREEMAAQLESEISRLRELKKVNRSVRAEEIELLLRQRRAVDGYLGNARLRLDSIRWIHRRRL
jgi:ATP-dependent helicase HepA